MLLCMARVPLWQSSDTRGFVNKSTARARKCNCPDVYMNMKVVSWTEYTHLLHSLCSNYCTSRVIVSMHGGKNRQHCTHDEALGVQSAK